MQNLLKLKWMAPFLMVLMVFAAVDLTVCAGDADARARGGGRSFGTSRSMNQPSRQQGMNQNRQQGVNQNNGAFGRGLMGGILGAGIGGLLFGSMFGMGGNGMGILPLLLLGAAGYFFYRRFMRGQTSSSGGGGNGNGFGQMRQGNPGNSSNFFGAQGNYAPVQDIAPAGEETGVSAITRRDPGFDTDHFLSVASDVFFKVQAGWTRRDFNAIRHLLGSDLAREYEGHFREMEAKGQLNKLENISIRKCEIADAGSDGSSDFVTVLFTANLLDYTVDERTGVVLSGSTTSPVKFAEKWTWARPVGTDDWLLEHIEEVQG